MVYNTHDTHFREVFIQFQFGTRSSDHNEKERTNELANSNFSKCVYLRNYIITLFRLIYLLFPFALINNVKFKYV